jgi:putative phosphoribosyl transferase
MLGELLNDSIIKKEEKKNDVVILGIPRAGVITADIVAKKLSIADFDITIPRKLTHPDNKEQAIGAIMEDATAYLKQERIADLLISQEYLEREKLIQIAEIKRRTALYRRETGHSFLKYKTVILVDDGAATGATIMAAAKWIREREKRQQKDQKEKNDNPKRLIIAVPIAPKHTVNLLKKECNAEVKAVLSPSSSSFHSIEQYHQNLEPVTDQQVIKIMHDRGLL